MEMAPACITLIWMISPYSRIKHACICGDTQQHKACGDTQQRKAAIFLIHDHYPIQIPVPRPLALNYLTSSPSDHCYAHQRNHYILLVLLVLQTSMYYNYIIYFKSCHSLAAPKVSPIGTVCPSPHAVSALLFSTSEGCTRLGTNSNCLRFAYNYVLCMVSPMYIAVT